MQILNDVSGLNPVRTRACVCGGGWRFLLEGLLDLRDARVLLHHQEIGFPVLVKFADAAEEEARARVLVPDNGDQFPAAGHHGAPLTQVSPGETTD